ncbi:hypothetical protein DRP53_07130 [candidate division WOR-3 bacterium]|uniref:Methionine synthase n=1 Tax=candidate division WOR-3 bacterium TaxID=2052148 RepID=A0A660SID2_UNCW3|nr:MAG: hypothetical protein DRP53_07130 [candidate division WOR-3 bacterium]
MAGISYKKTIVLDGAIGTELKKIYPDLRSEQVLTKDPDLIQKIHQGYADAGADIILTNTFGVNPSRYRKEEIERLIRLAVRLVRKTGRIVAGDIGPSGRIPEPFGDYHFDAMIEDYSFLARTLVRAGADILYLETFTSLIEARAAVLAARMMRKPVFVTLTFDDSLRTPFGDLPESCALILSELGATAVGANCATPEIVIEVLKRMRKVTDLPLIAKPNRGVPTETGFSYTPRKMASFIPELVGVAELVGGCCGTDYQFIRAVAKKRRRIRKRKRKVRILATPQRLFSLDHTLLVGERINPTGRKRLTRALRRGDLNYIVAEAKAQEKAGAEAIDLNLFLPDFDEKAAMARIAAPLTKEISIPVFVDTKDLSAAEAFIKRYPGIAVINSSRVVREELIRSLRLAIRYGSYLVVSLSGRKLPKDHQERMRYFRLARKIARRVGFPKEHLIYDPLVFPVASEPDQLKETLRTVQELSRRGELTILGISNVSYGMPERSRLNAALVAAAIHSGVSFIIANPMDGLVRDVAAGAGILFEGRSAAGPAKKIETLEDAIVAGDPRQALILARAESQPLKAIDEKVIPALRIVGKRYETGEIFLPQLLASAQAAKAAIDLLKERIPKRRTRRLPPVILATVEGDIHDLGKNILKTLLLSHGIPVLDLGVNVRTDRIVKTVREKRAKVVGLSALMTTTMSRMAEVAERLKKRGLKVTLIIGGAVVDERFARRIGARHARDAIAGVNLIKKILGV